MNVSSILGSPRKKGNTGRVLGWVEEELERLDHRVSRIDLVDHRVNGCKGCFTCKRSADEPGCPQKDDGVGILNRLIDSDVILYASPNYMWGLTSQMKALIDRHCSLVTGYGTPDWHSLLDGKGIALVVTCEDAIEGNCDLMMLMFERLAGYLKCSHMGSLVIPHATTPDALSEEARERAATFAQSISFSYHT
jgi:multimeric flavodoxin WrbA